VVPVEHGGDSQRGRVPIPERRRANPVKLLFLASEKPREQELAAAFCAGLARHGDTGHVLTLDGSPIVATGYDAAAFVGVKSRDLFRANRAAGIATVMLDKGYVRHKPAGSEVWEYWRTAVNHHHPTRSLAGKFPSDRADALGLALAPWRERGGHILIAGSSAKYHSFYDLPSPTDWATRMVEQIRRITPRPIVYRPKPSWRDAVAIPGTRYSGTDETLDRALAGAWALVTHGSNACFEATLWGVPSVILGDGVARPISSTRVEDVRDPWLASDADRRAWLAALCYHQWTLDEFASGEAWPWIRQEME